MIKNQEESIIQESQHWVRKNQGLELNGDEEYCSPRISSEIADCSMPMTFDHLNFCSLGCLYCFAYFFKSNNPAIKNIHLKSVNIDKMILAMQGIAKDQHGKIFYEHFYRRKFLLHWGGLADPFCYFEKKNRKGYLLIKALGEMNYPTLFSFKGESIFQNSYRMIFERYSNQKNFAFQISMVTGNDEIARKVEIGVPSPAKRLEAIKMLSEMGYWTILRLRPFIIGISDEGLDSLLERALKAGIKAVSCEFFALDCRCNVGMKSRYDWIAKLIGVGNIQKYFSALSPSERGGYMRLNRLVKEEYVKKIYKFCSENGLVCGISDPDYKELNTSGSCCGMPDNYPDNPLLENWTRNQLTFHLKEARRNFHKTGKKQILTFDSVYGDETYLDDRRLANDHVATVGCNASESRNLTHRIILQKQWNNLRSPANPRNYFHGKLLPTGLDDNGNYVFVYNPSEYEDRWKSEGINLTR